MSACLPAKNNASLLQLLSLSLSLCEMLKYQRMAATSSSSKKSDAARVHIEDIRKRKFSIGETRPNPLTLDLHNAVTSLSSQLYTKDVHFLMELIQNAEDNEYLPGVKPTLEFVITNTDITGVGAPATLLVFNNEVGFSKNNIDSLCSVGRSTKKGQRQHGYIGEKGIGFKSVFLVTALPHIFSNGYQIRFNEAPDKNCGIGYIVPEWISTKPCVSDLQGIYGDGKVLPSTTIILPLKPEKLEAVKKELTKIHPEVLLFLLKIKQLSVREHGGGSCSTDSVSAISITSDRKPSSLRSEVADTRIVDLSSDEVSGRAAASCGYFIWKQVFPVKAENVVKSRKDIKEWVISIAFPFGKRLNRGTSSSVGIFSFLPTAMVTNFPFIVQADFILVSSRETISLDSKWNKGILDHVPCCFVSALSTCMKSTESDELFSIGQVLELLPAQKSPYEELNVVRETIKTMSKVKRIVPYELFLNENLDFCKPTDAVRILPKFRNLLADILGRGATMNGISTQRRFILHKSVDLKKYDQIWEFLGIPPVGDCMEWYGNCIQDCSLILRASTDMYVELLCFLADNWKHLPHRKISSLPLLKYITYNGEMMPCSPSQSKILRIHLVYDVQQHAWIHKWNLAMGCPAGTFFFPDTVVASLMGNDRQHILRHWLRYNMNVEVTSVFSYCSKVCVFLGTTKGPKLAVSLGHFVYHSGLKNYINADEISKILHILPVVDAYGNVVPCTKTLVPAFGSRWKKLFGSNNEHTEDGYPGKYVVLGEVYSQATEFAGECTEEKKLLEFFQKHSKTSDLPDIFPEDAVFKAASTDLTSDQALSLLDWIRTMKAKKYEFPVKFINSIRNGKWMKTYSGFSSPIRCFLCHGKEISTLMEIGITFKLLSAIDKEYYTDQIISFKDELMFIGVQMKSEDMYQLIADHLKRQSSLAMSRECAISLLRFVKYSKENNKLNEDFLKTLKMGKWLKTIKGYMTPAVSIFLASNLAEALKQITDLHVIDNIYYGSQLDYFMDELKSLGVLMDVGDVYNLLPQHFRFPEDPSTMIKDSVFLLLECIQHLGPVALGLKHKVRCQPWMKTSSGFKCPSESLLSDHMWGHLLNIVPLPIIDEAFYGIKIRLYKGELEEMGVTVDLDAASKMVSAKLKLVSSSRKLTSANVISLLKCLKYMCKSKPSLLINITNCLSGEKWLKTSLGYKSPADCILYESKWGTVSQFVDLPLIDITLYGVEIYSFRDELKMLGVVVNFREGAHFVAKGLHLPKEPSSIPPECALSLLQCAKSLRNSKKLGDRSLVEPLHIKLKGSKWMKTHMGYRSPEESLLFNPDWECYLKLHDAPFIDEGFYGTLGSSEKDDLKAIGVKADVEEVCSIIYQTLNLHTQTCAIVRLYRFLDNMKWSPKSEDKFSSQLWIPDQDASTGGGKWVSSRICVLQEDSGLFRSHLHALDGYYDVKFLSFFSTAFGVLACPSRDDYVKLWNDWASCKHHVSAVELNSFWGYISQNWDTEMERTVKTNITMLPATAHSGTVLFVNKEEVFIPDDLQLKKSFTEATEMPLFVWLPQTGLSSVSPKKLCKIYRKIGVPKISESVQVDPSCTVLGNCKLETMDLKHGLDGKALITIVLSFLASPSVNMPAALRHKAANSLIDISFSGVDEPMMVSYGLHLHSLKKKLSVEIRRMVLWEKNFRRLLVHKPTWEDGNKNIEFVTTFARAISEAVVPSTDHVNRLCNIIKMGFAFGFRGDAVDFLLLTENLELPVEDKEFLDRAFTPVCPSLKRRHFPIIGSSSKKRFTCED